MLLKTIIPILTKYGVKIIGWLNPVTEGGLNTGLKTSSNLIYNLIEKYKLIRRLLLLICLWLTIDILNYGKNLGLIHGDIPSNVTSIVLAFIGLLTIFVSFYTMSRTKEANSHLTEYTPPTDEKNSKE